MKHSTGIDAAIALASRISAKAETVLASVELEMSQWPKEYRAIMWQAIADAAAIRARSDQDSPWNENLQGEDSGES